MDSNYFLVKFKEKETNEKGGIKWVSHQYLVEALSITEAEAKLVKHMSEFPRIEYAAVSVSKSPIEEILE